MKAPRLISGYHRIPPSAIIKEGDRIVYADGQLGPIVPKSKWGVIAKKSGYIAVARKTRT